MSSRIKLTLFDLDHTLLPIDSDFSWGVFTTQIGWTDPVEFQQKNEEFFAHYKAGTLNIADYVRFSTEAIRVHGATQSIAAHRRFMRDMIENELQPEALALVKQHQDAGDTVLIVTATNEFVARPIAMAFGVAALIAVELEHDPRPAAEGGTDWITGEIKGVPSAREGKVTRVAEWLASQNLGWTDVESRFYTDSINDITLLEQVNFPVATNPDDRLRALATARGWPILDLVPKR